MIKADFPSHRRLLEIIDTTEYQELNQQCGNCLEALALWVNKHQHHQKYGLNKPTFEKLQHHIKPCTHWPGYYAIVDEDDKTHIYVFEYIDIARTALF